MDSSTLVWCKGASNKRIRLGKGSSAVVWLGKHCGADVAIKVLNDDHALDDYQAESHILQQLRHVNIVQYYGHCEFNDHLCIVLEYMSNRSLYECLCSSSVPWARRRQFAEHIINGLEYLSSRGIIHRDLKSPNVLLSSEWVAKLSDFGLSKALADGRSYVITNGRVGSVAWMAPELFNDTSRYSSATDIYALGMTFWEIIALNPQLKNPYSTWNHVHIPMRVQNGEREVIPIDCPVDFRAIIEDCWQSEPSLRPTIGVVADRLRFGQVHSNNNRAIGKKQPCKCACHPVSAN